MAITLAFKRLQGRQRPAENRPNGAGASESEGALMKVTGNTAIFDLDGTLADTSADLIAAANACFADEGASPPLCPEADAATAFRGGRAMLRLGFERLEGRADPVRVEAAFPRFLAHYEAGIDRHTRLYDGVEEALALLSRGGWRLGICTNKPERLAEMLMRRLGMRAPFATLIGAGTLPTRKPDPAPLLAAIEGAGGVRRRAVLIGDTETDRATARNAGVPCVLVTFGPAGRAAAALEPEALLDHYDALPGLLAGLVEGPGRRAGPGA